MARKTKATKDCFDGKRDWKENPPMGQSDETVEYIMDMIPEMTDQQLLDVSNYVEALLQSRGIIG